MQNTSWSTLWSSLYVVVALQGFFLSWEVIFQINIHYINNPKYDLSLAMNHHTYIFFYGASEGGGTNMQIAEREGECPLE